MVLIPVAAGLVYLVAALGAIAVARLPGVVASIWIANALALTFLIRRPRHEWPLIAGAVVLACIAANMIVGDTIGGALALAAANTIEILLAGLLIRALHPPDFRYVDHPLAFFQVLAIAAVIAPAAGSLVGAAAVTLIHDGPFDRALLAWWSGAAIGAVVVLPVTLSASRDAVREATGGRNGLELLAIAAAAAGLITVAVSHVDHPFVIVALLLGAAALRLLPFAMACVSAVVVAAITMAGLAGAIPGIASGDDYLGTTIRISAALSVLLPFAISLLVTQLRRDRTRLAESEERFRNAMQSSAIGMALVGLDGRWMAVNQATCDLLGYSGDELHKLTFQDLTHPEDLDADLDLVRKTIAGEIDSYRMEKRYIRKDGSIVWGLLVVAIVRHPESGDPLHFVSQIEDITDRKEAEEKLAESERRWAFALEGGRQGVWDYDIVSGRTYYSPTWCRLFGYEAEEFGNHGDAWQALVHPDDLRKVLQADADHRAGRTPFLELEMRLRHRDGRWIWVLDRAKVVERGADGEPLRMIGTYTDITRLKEAEEALAASESRWSFALEGARQGVWDVDLKNRRTYLSPVWKAIIGYRDDEFGDDQDLWLEHLHPADRERVMRADAIHQSGVVDEFENEFRMRHKDGHYVWILDRGKVVGRDENGRPLRLIGTHTDITAQKRDQERMRLLSERMARATRAGRVGLWEIDIQTGEVWWDEGNHLLHGTDPGSFNPEDFETLVHPDDRSRIRQMMADLLAGRRVDHRGYRIVTRAGETRHLRSSPEILRGEDGNPVRIVGANWDITQEAHLTEALSEEKERLRVTLESIGEAVICTDRERRISFMNPVAAGLTGWPPRRAIGEPVDRVFRVVDEATGAPADYPVEESLRQLKPVTVAEGLQLVDQAGRRIDIRTTVSLVRTDDADILGTVIVFHDISEERRARRQMAHSAAHDPLTELRNRASFEEDLAEACAEVENEGRVHSVCFVDLDRFKQVNDRAGHAAGDALLRDISATIRAGVRAHDVSARIGGDEFGLLLRDCTAAQALAIAEKLIEAISGQRFVWEGLRFEIGASVGVCRIRTGARPADVLHEADMACYAAKAAGRNRARIYEEPDAAARVANAG